MKSNNNSKGFTLIELMIFIAILGILAAVAVPQYNTYQKRARFSEVIIATTAFKTPAEVAIQTGRAVLASELNNGAFGIPPAINDGAAVSSYVSTVAISGGVITATGREIVNNATYVVKGEVILKGIRWAEDITASTCFDTGLC